MNDLAGKHIVLGLTGGIACYKAAELCRALVKEGATVQVVMTAAAEQFITPVTLQALSGRPVYTSQWDTTAGTLTIMGHAIGVDGSIGSAAELLTLTLVGAEVVVAVGPDTGRSIAVGPSVLVVGTGSGADLALSAEKLASKPFAHLPVLGVPGWCAANEDPAFYADVSVFRPAKKP